MPQPRPANEPVIGAPSHVPGARERVRQWGAVLWPSFLIAGVATTVFFANVDPEELRASTVPGLQFDRRLGYTVGFFMFWGVTTWSSFLTMLLLRPVARPQRPTGAVDVERR